MQDILSRNIAPELGYRIIFVSAKKTAQEIGGTQHQLAGEALSIFADGMVASLLLASQLKGNGVLSFEFDSDGPFNNYRSDATPLGYIRAMIPDETKEKIMLTSPETELIGKGNMYIGKKISDGNAPFSSILEMPTTNIAKNVAHYLKNSEQINGMVGIQTIVESTEIKKCCGFLIEELPNVSSEQRLNMEEAVKNINDFGVFFEDNKPIAQTIAETLPNIKVQNMKDFEVQFFCPCTGKRFLDSLIGLNQSQLESLAEDNLISTTCDFCKSNYDFNLDTILQAKKEG